MISKQPQPPGSWADHAACRGQHHLFVINIIGAHRYTLHRKHHTQANQAIRICHSCPVITQCRQWAMTEPDPAYDHIAGGLTPRDRYRIKAQTNRAT